MYVLVDLVRYLNKNSEYLQMVARFDKQKRGEPEVPCGFYLR